ncbi:MAG: hypothetical protein JNK25_14985 [Phycisphaerae bacterium]|nr:hypothetical protein [Phycisphaerae bacterium]
MFEHRSQRVVSTGRFVRRQAGYLLTALALTAASLAGGAVGYHTVEPMSWTQAFHAAAMILTGMGPVVNLTTETGMLFETAYALFSGVVFLLIVSIILAPGVHRLLHVLHVEK